MSDSFAVKMVCVVLGVIAVGGSATVWALSVQAKAIPEELVASTAAAVTGLLGLLAATRTGTTDVQVVNQPADPVPVAENPPNNEGA